MDFTQSLNSIRSYLKSQLKINVPEPTTILKMNYDCMELIFRYLHLKDLMNVAVTCVELNSHASQYFTQTYRNGEVCIDCNQFPRFRLTYSTLHANEKFVFDDIIGFIEAFGELVPKLTIRNLFPLDNCAPRLANDTLLQESIVKHCREHVRQMRFITCGEATMNNVLPFTKLEKVIFDGCHMGEMFSDFKNLFPNIRKLEMIDCNVTNAHECIQDLQLECLNITVPLALNAWANCAFTVADVKAAIDANPTIHKLALCYWNQSAYDAKLLKYVSLNLPFLKTLKLWHIRFNEFNTEGDIYFSSVRKFTLANSHHVIGRLELNFSKLWFPELDKFYMIDEFDMECISFIGRHKTIRNLYFLPSGNHDFYPTDFDIKHFVDLLPNLEKFVVSGRRLTTNGLLRFISQCKTVSIVKVRQHKFNATIRYLFKDRCIDLGWDAVFGQFRNEPEITLKRR